jgi:hypothetical protein
MSPAAAVCSDGFDWGPQGATCSVGEAPNQTEVFMPKRGGAESGAGGASSHRGGAGDAGAGAQSGPGNSKKQTTGKRSTSGPQK